jgi:hypothetical protein
VRGGFILLIIISVVFIAGCRRDTSEVEQFVVKAVDEYKAKSPSLDQNATKRALDDLAAYSSRMSGQVITHGCDYSHPAFTCTVSFAEGADFWFVVRDVDGALTLVEVHAIDLDEGHPID